MARSIAKKKTRELILKLSVPFFAKYGYNGVSMRDIAAAVELTPAALYYHFPDKEQLYIDVVAHEFQGKSVALTDALIGPESAWERLKKFIESLAQLAATDESFVALMQRVRLDSNADRQHKLAEYVFKDLFFAVHDLVSKLNLRYDAHMLSMSIFGMIFFPVEMGAIRMAMPGYSPEQTDPVVLARHVVDFLRMGVKDIEGVINK
ncbi:MAG: TetR/AcrR family transcriptional regulator [Proteobacteria bacterium]|nr:TetR/AcrR family transcriptional regulator [Pseudomonadota bacterium]